MAPDLVPAGIKTITKSDSTIYSPPLAGFMAAAGNVAITDVYGNTTTITVIANQPYMVQCVKIMSTNTTSTTILGFLF